MMRPTLYQLIQYVRDGETDPGLAAALRADPDSDRRLRRARFICKMIGRQDKPAPPTDESRSITFDALSDSIERFEPRHRMMQSVDLDLMASEVGGAYEREDQRQVPEIRSMVLGSTVPGRDFGLLTVSEQDGHIEMSLQSDQEVTNTPSGEIRINVDGCSVSMTARFPAAELLQLRFARSPGGPVYSGLEVLFMPASGPFIRRSTDKDGAFELPFEAIPGMLRISAQDFVFLRIARNK